MTETPETDALWERYVKDRDYRGQFLYGPGHLADHARKLERERDALAKACADWKEVAGNMLDVRLQFTALRSDMALILRHIDADDSEPTDEP